MKVTSVLTLLVAMFGFSSVADAQRWELFGDAASIKDKTTPGENPWVIELVSDIVDPEAAGFAGIAYNPTNDLDQFDQIFELSALYDVTDDDCGGGSPRFQISIDSDGDGDHDGNIFVYLGPSPFFTGCLPGWNDSGNLIGNEDAGRWDATQLGGPLNGYSGVAAHMDTLPDHQVLSVLLVVDAGWFFADGEQTILVDNVAVNEHLMNGRNFKKNK